MKAYSNKKKYSAQHWRHKEHRERFTEDVPICQHFGCTNIITPEQYFFNSKYCPTHARENKQK
jgi:Rieske Fe-S protein